MSLDALQGIAITLLGISVIMVAAAVSRRR